MHTFLPASARFIHEFVAAHVQYWRKCAHASLFSHLIPTFGSNFWVNKQRAALFLVSFFQLLLCAPYLRLILAQTSMKPMQMIRERKVSFAAAAGKNAPRRQSPASQAHPPLKSVASRRCIHRKLHFCTSVSRAAEKWGRRKNLRRLSLANVYQAEK
jgi:hypothetical protein